MMKGVLNQTLEILEKNVWTPSESGDSYLIRTCSMLRKKKLKDFTTEDLRIMIGQQIGLEYLMPIALEILLKGSKAKGDFFESDLLKSVLEVGKEFWDKNKDCSDKLKRIKTT